jgi:hypothetical protein
MNKPEYIKKIENTEGVLSVVILRDSIESVSKIDKNKNLTLVYMESEFHDNRPKFKSKLYKTSTGFYIYWKQHPVVDKFEIEIYHKPENINEVTIFLSQLNKK